MVAAADVQLLAETEKYPHVTFFLMVVMNNPGEDRVWFPPQKWQPDLQRNER